MTRADISIKRKRRNFLFFLIITTSVIVASTLYLRQSSNQPQSNACDVISKVSLDFSKERIVESPIESVYDSAIDTANNLLFVGGTSSQIQVLDLASGLFLEPITTELKGFSSLDISENERHLVGGTFAGEIVLWERKATLESWRYTPTILPGNYSDIVNSVSINKDGSIIAASIGKSIVIWERDKADGGWKVKSNIFSAHSGAEVWAISISHGEDFVFSGGNDKQVKLWEFRNLSSIEASNSYRKKIDNVYPVTSIFLSKDKAHLLIGSDNGKIKKLGLLDDASLLNFSGQHDSQPVKFLGGVESIPQALLSSSNDKTIKIWNVCSGQLIQTLEGHETWVTTASSSTISGELVLISIGLDGEIIVWKET